MKKILYLLFSVCIITACSSDDHITYSLSTDPLKGDEVTVDQIIGTYKSYEIVYDNTGNGIAHGFFEDNIELTFNADNTGEEKRNINKIPFTWSYNDRVISFSYSLHKNIRGWFDKSGLKYRTDDVYGSGVKSESIATVTFVKK